MIFGRQLRRTRRHLAAMKNERVLSRGLLLSALILLPFSLEYLERGIEIAPYRPSDPFLFAVVKPEYWYDKITSVSFLKPKHLQVSSVVISSAAVPEEVRGEHPCTARLFLAALLAKIENTRPLAIVIDRWFPPIDSSICPRDADGTAKLTQTMQAVSRTTPIIIAEAASNDKQARGNCIEDIPDLPGDTVIMSSRVMFENSGSDITYGLPVFNEENRKIPLGWYAYDSCVDAFNKKNRHLVPSLSVAAISAARHQTAIAFLKENDLIANYTRVHHPFTNFLLENQVPQVSALTLLCGQAYPTGKPVDWRHCHGGASKETEAKMSGQIVIVGDERGDDIWQTVIGPVPGFILHANYIESLSQGRFFKTIPTAVQLLISVGWFGIVELIFLSKRFTPLNALTVALVVTIVLATVFYSVLLVYAGYYAVLFVPTVLGLVVRGLSGAIEQKQVRNEVSGHDLPVQQAS